MALSRELKPKLELAKDKTTEDKADKKPICQGCDVNEATLFCHACFEDLCDTCSRTHAKYLGPDHVCGKLSDKSMMVSKLVPKSAEESPETSKCVHHLGTEVSQICKQCRVLVCTKCMQNIHKDHDVVPFENAASLLMEICNHDVKLLLDALTNVHNVGSDRDSALSIDNAIQQLKQKQNDLFKMITEHVTKSIARLKEEKERFVKRATAVEETATGTAERMEFNITQLNTARKGRDINGMVAEICRCDHIMNDVKKFVDGFGQDRNESYTVDSVLPRLREYDKQSQKMVKVFDIELKNAAATASPMSYLKMHYSPVNNSAIATKKAIKDVKGKGERNFPVKTAKFEYKMLTKQRTTKIKQGAGKLCFYNHASMPRFSNSSQFVTSFAIERKKISIINYITGDEHKQMAQCYICICIHLSENRYIASNRSNINLCDSSFSVLHEYFLPWLIKGMCCISTNEVLVYAYKESGHENIFTVYKIIDDKFIETNTFIVEDKLLTHEENRFCGICPTLTKNKILVVFSGAEKSDISIVNLETGSVDICQIKVKIWEHTPFVDENGDLLVYTGDSKIQLFRNIENGVDDAEILTNLVIDDGPVKAIIRNGNNLLLGYFSRVEHYSLSAPMRL